MTMTDSSGASRPLLTLPAVAERLGVNERHVRRLVAERRIPFVEVGAPAAVRPWRARGVDRARPQAASLMSQARAYPRFPRQHAPIASPGLLLSCDGEVSLQPGATRIGDGRA